MKYRVSLLIRGQGLFFGATRELDGLFNITQRVPIRSTRSCWLPTVTVDDALDTLPTVNSVTTEFQPANHVCELPPSFQSPCSWIVDDPRGSRGSGGKKQNGSLD